MSIATETISAVERAAHALRFAISTSDQKQIDRAATRLEQAREAESRRIARAKDKLDAQIAVDAQKRDADRAAKKARADAAEAELRATTPTICFEACGRRVTVLMSVAGLEPSWAVEATRRLAWGAAKSFAERVVASRNLGAAAPEPDWLSPLMSDQTHGVELHLRRGVVSIEEIV